ncbi:hypothetical protein SAMN02745121_08247 [Nannocystis exedens]|uniref:Uncharacterized protein n=1 Tax=Nannocystis exedens TaxID=54 RepID=A0A1I2HUX8_9BACT|nr:hypothetical protein [Nannocystis exedens]PCC72023.1 hypothetical protein NAEX_05102 [Nannocystis exedens]SFF33965.1 hypothetical protein SAMN02745121_08247 [Nannocystis exedens]
MSERHVQCSACEVLRPESEAHNIPTLAGEQYVDGYYCSAHAGAALDAARAHVAGLDFEDDTRDDMMPLVTLHALVRARGLMSESLDPPAPGEGLERVRNEALALLDLLRHTRLPIVEPSALCSGCYRAVPASQVRVIPWFNDHAAAFVTTFRCGDCFAASLADTRARLTFGGPGEVARLAEFFHRHAVTIHEHRRGDPPEAVRPLLALALDHLAAGTLKLQIGETVPLNDVRSAPSGPPPAAAPAPSTPPEPAAAPPPAAPEPRPGPSLWQRIRRAFGRSGD